MNEINNLLGRSAFNEKARQLYLLLTNVYNPWLKSINCRRVDLLVKEKGKNEGKRKNRTKKKKKKKKKGKQKMLDTSLDVLIVFFFKSQTEI